MTGNPRLAPGEGGGGESTETAPVFLPVRVVDQEPGSPHIPPPIDLLTRRSSCGTFGAEDITAGFSEFLGYFMPRKVIAGNETMKAAGTVIKKLAKWLVEKGYTEDDESIRKPRLRLVSFRHRE